ncbi:MAG: acyl-CoA thioesterase [Lactobacillaceae bacterium]|nr:acyl-CoA thioesterase [Lactobacillaceae bacterium]
MSEMHINASLVILNHRVMVPDLNEHHTVFGGQILSLVDSSASVSAMRAARQTVVTGTIDHINFLQPFDLRHAMSVESYVTGIGKRSIEVFTKIIGEDLQTGERFLGFYAFTTFVVQAAEFTNVDTQLLTDTHEQAQLVASYAKRKQQRDVVRLADKALTTAIQVE